MSNFVLFYFLIGGIFFLAQIYSIVFKCILTKKILTKHLNSNNRFLKEVIALLIFITISIPLLFFLYFIDKKEVPIFLIFLWNSYTLELAIGSFIAGVSLLFQSCETKNKCLKELSLLFAFLFVSLGITSSINHYNI